MKDYVYYDIDNENEGLLLLPKRMVMDDELEHDNAMMEI